MALSTREIYLVLRARDEASRIIRSFGDRLSRTAVTLQQFGAAAISIGAGMTALGAAGLSFVKSNIEVAAEYDRQARRTLTQVDQIGVSLEEVADIGRRVAGEIGVPFETLQDTLFFIFSSIDVNLRQSEKLLRGFAKEAVAGQTDIEAAARTSIAIMNALQIPVKDLTRLQDIQFQIIRKGIISYEELSNTIGRALPATSRAGQSFETLGAMIAFMTRNGLSAAMASTSAARALEAFAHPTTVGRIEDMGIKVRDAKGEFLPLVDVLGDLTKEMEDMGSVERSEFMQELFKGSGGRIQARRFFDLAFANFEQFEGMMGHMENSAGSFQEAYENMSGAVSTEAVTLNNKWMLLKEALGTALIPAMHDLVDLLSQALDWFNALPESTKETISKAIALGSVIAVVVGSILMAVGVLALFVAGLMMAGGALATAAAVIGGVIAAVALLGGAIYAAWQNSKPFRDFVKNLGEAFLEVRDAIVEAALDLKDKFEQDLLPALQRLGEAIEENVLPIAQMLVDNFRENILPVLEDVAGFLRDTLSAAFEMVASAIDDLLIPAVERINEFYKEHEDSIKTLLKIINKLQYVLIILAIPILLVAAAIVIIIAVIYVLVEAFMFLMDILFKAGESFVQLVTDWDGFTKIIGKRWSQTWRGIANFFVNIWNHIVAQTKFWWNVFLSFFRMKLNQAKAAWDRVWGAITKFFRGSWNTMLGIGRNMLGAITGAIRGAGRSIRRAWNNAMGAIARGTRNRWKAVKKAFRSSIRTVKNFFSGAKNWLFNAGKNIIQGLIDGISNMFGPLGNIAERAAGLIGGFFPGSPVKRGPLRALNHGRAGGEIVKMLAEGMTSNDDVLLRALSTIANKLAMEELNTTLTPAMTSQLSQAPVGVGDRQGSASAPMNQTITVNTNEIDPVKHAVELGWLLEARS